MLFLWIMTANGNLTGEGFAGGRYPDGEAE